jgi:hypothetical protein
MALELARIEEKIDRVAAGGTEVAMGFGGVKFATLLELMEFAKLMAVSGSAVPVHLRGNPGTCLAVCTKALRYGFDPFSLAEHSYTMSKSMKVDGQWQDVETIAYDSFVIHAIIEAHGDVTGKLKPTYIGEGDDMKCICTGVVNGETLEVETDTVGKIKARIGRNDKGKLKGSPLWESKPKQQLWYDARRDWCRAHQPHILLGWYDKDELQEHGPDVRDVTPAKPDIASRLKGGKGRGFSANHVERETRGVIDTEVQREAGVNVPANAPSGDELRASDQEPLSNGSGAAQDRSESAAPTLSDSSQASPQASPTETDKPASAAAVDAGNNSGSAAGQDETADSEARAGDDSISGGSPSLPMGWEITYAAALRRAQKPESLSKYASQYWEQYGGWPAHKDGPNGATAAAIYSVFKDNFGRKDVIEAQLRELI